MKRVLKIGFSRKSRKPMVVMRLFCSAGERTGPFAVLGCLFVGLFQVCWLSIEVLVYELIVELELWDVDGIS